MPAIHVWPKRLKEFLLAHPLYKSPTVQYRPQLWFEKVNVGLGNV